MSNYLVALEVPGQPLQRLQLVARDKAAAIIAALELVPTALRARVLLEGEW